MSKKIFCKQKSIARVKPGGGGDDDPPPPKILGLKLCLVVVSITIGVSEGLSQGGPTSFIPPNYLSILLPPLYQYEMILSYLVKPHDTTQHTKKNYRL